MDNLSPIRSTPFTLDSIYTATFCGVTVFHFCEPMKNRPDMRRLLVRFFDQKHVDMMILWGSSFMFASVPLLDGQSLATCLTTVLLGYAIGKEGERYHASKERVEMAQELLRLNRYEEVIRMLEEPCSQEERKLLQFAQLGKGALLKDPKRKKEYFQALKRIYVHPDDNKVSSLIQRQLDLLGEGKEKSWKKDWKYSDEQIEDDMIRVLWLEMLHQQAILEYHAKED